MMIDHLHRASWLALTSHVVFNSKQCSQELAMAMALSLIPHPWNDIQYSPTKKELQGFVSWFHDLVSNAERRRAQTLRANRRAGAPAVRRQKGKNTKHGKLGDELEPPDLEFQSYANRLVEYCGYLASSLTEDPQLFYNGRRTSWTNADKINLFITMAR